MFGLSPLPRTFAAAMRDVESRRTDTRRSALIDLVRYVDSEQRNEVAQALDRIVKNDPDAEVRSLAAIAIADGGFTELADTLAAALDDNAPRVQQMALLALGEVGKALGSQGMKRIERLLTSELPAIRYQALVAWSSLSGSDGIAALVSATNDHDEEVRWIACRLIDERIRRAASTERDIQSMPDDDALTPTSQTKTIPLLNELQRCAHDSAMRVRIAASVVLYRLGDERCLAQLLELVQRRERLSRDEVIQLVHEFGQLRYEPARAWLSARARRGWLEGPLGWPALVALGALGDEAARAEVVRELDASSLRRRTRAVVAVGELRLKSASERILGLRARPSGLDPSVVEQTLRALTESDGC
ncbi:MAG TPA: HEAT repeat domain-containing protein [Polyangiaceae bacterium]|nr:HEAT repeat domain-containing protein [Polyangiaceae bacterium]